MRSNTHNPDYFLMATVFLLTVAGLAILTSASSDLGKIKFNDSYYYLKHQIYSGLLAGILGFLAAYQIPYKWWRRMSLPLLLLNIALLGLVFTPLGHSAGGSIRWINIGQITFQPAELLKLTFILYLAAFFSNPKFNRGVNLKTGIIPFLVIAGVMALLLVLQPATSTVAILIGTGVIMLFLSGASLKHIFWIGLGGLLILVLIIVATPYRLKRVQGWFNKTDTQGASFHLNQSLIALGSGGKFGVGFGQSKAKISSLPEVVGDSIFAVAGQELGFIGAGFLIMLFVLLVFRMFYLARGFKDRFGQLALMGFATIIALQSMVNIGAISGVLPLTGVPLPFVSYGGTALAVFLTMSGLAANISKYS